MGRVKSYYWDELLTLEYCDYPTPSEEDMSSEEMSYIYSYA